MEDIKNTHDKEECRGEFLSQKNFFRYVITAIITVLTLMGSSFVWAMGISNNTAVLKEGVTNNKKRIETVEKNQRDLHKEQMELLKNIYKKVSE